MGQDHQEAYIFYGLQLPFSVTGHEQHEGSKEAKYKIEPENEPVGYCPALLEVNGLFRNIGIQDQQYLGDENIRPENAKRKHEITKIMNMVFINNKYGRG